MGRGDHGSVLAHDQHVQADHLLKCPLLWHSTP